jgi:predicted ATPase
MKYIITGGPGSGKSSIVKSLAARGYTTIDEAAMPIKAHELLRKRLGLPHTLPENDNLNFQRLIYTRQLDLESQVRESTFIDRGVIDNIGYCRRFGTPISDELHNICSAARYDKVFLLDPLPKKYYRQEEARDENYEESLLLFPFIEQAYEQYGHKVVCVPYFDLPEEESIDRRVEFILRHTEEKTWEMSSQIQRKALTEEELTMLVQKNYG